MAMSFKEYRELKQALETQRIYTIATLQCQCRVHAKKAWRSSWGPDRKEDEFDWRWAVWLRRKRGCKRKHAFIIAVAQAWRDRRNEELGGGDPPLSR